MSRLLIAAIVVLGVVIVARFTIWAPVDERAHYAYVESIVEHGRLPRLTDLNSPDVEAISDRTFPRRSPTDPATLGLGGQSYEAFQPPLYYALAAPVFAVGGNAKQKVHVVRTFDLLLLLASIAVLWRVARRRPEALAAGLLVLAWPGLIVRGVTISTDALLIPLVPAFLLAAWRAYDRRDRRWLIGAAVLFGLCLLTKVTLVYLGPSLLLAAWACRRDLRAAAAAVALPVAMLAPWLLSNHARYGTWTQNAAARRQQIPYLYPHGVPHFGVGDLPGKAARMLQAALPGEWDGQLHVWWVGILARALVVVVVVAALLAARRDERVRFFALPLLVGLAIAAYTLLGPRWDVFSPRYYAAALPPLAITVALALRPPRWALWTLAAGVGLLWVDMLGAYLFLDVGAKLGI